MSYYIVDRDGGGTDEDDEASVDRMRFHLKSLDAVDDEHPSVRLVHRESRWGIEVYSAGSVILANVKIPDSERHMRAVSRERALELWQMLARGEIDRVMQEPWVPGY